MNIGYIRVSTTEQNTDRQEEALKEICEKFYIEKVSGKDTNRPALQEMLENVKEGDVVYITELSRLGRSMIDLYNIAKQLKEKNVELKSLKESISITDNSPTSKFTFGIFGLMAEFERDLIRERQREGIKIALEKGKPYGRPKTYENSDEIVEKYLSGEITRVEAIERVNCSTATFTILVREFKKNNPDKANDLRHNNNRWENVGKA